MIRTASIMYLFPEHYDEYAKRHDELWPEMKKELKAHGAHNYSIFLDEQCLLTWKLRTKTNGCKSLIRQSAVNGGITWRR